LERFLNPTPLREAKVQGWGVVTGLPLLEVREDLEHRAKFEEERGKGSALVFGHQEPSWRTLAAAAIWNRPWVSGPTSGGARAGSTSVSSPRRSWGVGVESAPIRVEVDPGAVAISDFLAFG
jgi:hypothetical protein